MFKRMRFTYSTQHYHNTEKGNIQKNDIIYAYHKERGFIFLP